MLIGGGGYDHYVIARGQGHDTLINWIGEARGALHIDNESRESLWFQRAGNDLRVQLLGSDTDITVQGWYDNSVSRLNRIALGGSHTDYLLGTHVDQLVQAMAGFSGSHPGFDPKASAVISDATAYAVRLAQGKNAEALKELQAIKDWSLAGPSTYDLMISYHLKRGDGQAALAMIDKAERNLGSEELFITEKLLANQQLKNTQQVQTVLRKCEQYPTRKENCKKLAPIKA